MRDPKSRLNTRVRPVDWPAPCPSTGAGSRRPERNAIRDLRGIGKGMFAAFGGGERWLLKERESFYGAEGSAEAFEEQRNSD